MKNHELFKFTDIVSDIIVDYYNDQTNFKSENEVLKYIEELCLQIMTKQWE